MNNSSNFTKIVLDDYQTKVICNNKDCRYNLLNTAKKLNCCNFKNIRLDREGHCINFELLIELKNKKK